jgi:Tfp pilus assembly protein PilN
MDATTIIVLFLVLGILLLFQRISSLSARLDGISRLEGKIDTLLQHQGIQYDPLGDVPPQVREALDKGERILAIKRLREATGVGLKEAKERVDELWRRSRNPSPG